VEVGVKFMKYFKRCASYKRFGNVCYTCKHVVPKEATFQQIPIAENGILKVRNMK
jgi:hypothetical protein